MVWQQRGNDVLIQVKVQPKAKRSEIVGLEADALKIKVNVPPEKGKANEACIKLLANALKLPKRDIELLQGQTSRQKRFLIKNVSIDYVKKALGVD